MQSGIGTWYYDSIERPKLLAADDFWGHVRRTEEGEVFPQEQLDMLCTMVRQGLCFKPDDVLLDCCCGNGRLGMEFFDDVAAYLGVDLSPILIEIAKKNFEKPLTHMFLLKGLLEYCKEEEEPQRFTKLMMYGAISLFSDEQVQEVFTLLYKRFTGLKRLFIGAILDKDKVNELYKSFESTQNAWAIDDHTTSRGVWHNRSHIKNMLESCGWKMTVLEMPKTFYQAHYRYQAILERE